MKAISAGGRHSAAITYCHKVLSWGWGEEVRGKLRTKRNTFFIFSVGIRDSSVMVGRKVVTFRDQFVSPKFTERYRGGKLA